MDMYTWSLKYICITCITNSLYIYINIKIYGKTWEEFQDHFRISYICGMWTDTKTHVKIKMLRVELVYPNFIH